MAYTTTNLFTNYHNNLVNMVIDDDTKVVTAYFNLKPADIISLQLSKIIYLNGVNYVINSIKDYNANGRQLTKVELVRIIDAIGIPTFKGLIEVSGISPQITTPSNFVQISGRRFQTALIPNDTTFAYWELQGGLSDTLNNFPNMQLVNSGSTSFETIKSLRCLIMDSASNGYAKTDPDPNAGYTNVGFLGSSGTTTNTMGLRVHFSTDQNHNVSGSGKQTLWFAGNTTSSLSYQEVYIDNDGKLNWERFDSGSGLIETVSSSAALNNDTWYAVTFRYKHDTPNDRELWLNNTLVGTMNQQTIALDIPVDPALDSVYLGHNPYTNKTTDAAFRTLRMINDYVTGEDFEKLKNNDIFEVILRDVDTGFEQTIDPSWYLGVSDTQFNFTVPQIDENQFFDPGTYKLRVRYGNYTTNEFDFKVNNVDVLSSSLDIRFDSMEAFTNNFDYLERQWGGDNGGVVSDNVVFEEVSGSLELVTYANGDNYTGSITGVDNLGNPTSRKDRVGGAIVSKKYWGFGEYTVEAKVPSLLGVAPAFWTFHYEEIYRGDPRYEIFKSESLHEQGSEQQGFYITRNHEIDIEFPSHLPQEDIQQSASLDNSKMNSWRGELKSDYGAAAWQNSGSSFYEEYRDWLVPIKETHKNQMTGSELQFDGGNWSGFGGATVNLTQNQDLFRVTSGSATRIQTTGGSTKRKFNYVTTKDTNYDHFFGVWVYNQGTTDVTVISNATSFPSVIIPTGSLKYVAQELEQNGNSFCTLEFQVSSSADDLDVICYEPLFKEGSQRGTTQITPVNRLSATEQQFEGRWTGSTTPVTESLQVSGSSVTGYRINAGSTYELTFTSSKAADTFLYEDLPYRYGMWIQNNQVSDDIVVTMSGSVGIVQSASIDAGDTEYVRIKGVCNDATGSITVKIENNSGVLDFTGYDPILAEYSIDGYREYGWTWEHDEINFYVDGQLQDTIRNNISSSIFNIVDENVTGYHNSYVIPDIPGKMNAGMWFPSAGSGSNWAGDVNGEAPWSRVKMPIRRIKFTPTTNSASLAAQRNIGETYATIGIDSPGGADRGSGDVTEG